MKTPALVLLSGGLDSTAALWWAKRQDYDVRAVSFLYGQRHAVEVEQAEIIADVANVPRDTIRLGEAVSGLRSLAVAAAGTDDRGVSKASLPSRNMTLLSAATTVAMQTWPGERVFLVIGCNGDDAAAFPDCRRDFLAAAGAALSRGLGATGSVVVVAPWLDRPKAGIIQWAWREGVLDHLRHSISCYAGQTPGCGNCDACGLRERAFRDAGYSDGPLP